MEALTVLAWIQLECLDLITPALCCGGCGRKETLDHHLSAWDPGSEARNWALECSDKKRLVMT